VNIAQWQGWTTPVLSFNLAESTSYRALLKNILNRNVHKGTGRREK